MENQKKAWNKNKSVGQKMAFSEKEVKLLRDILKGQDNKRDLALLLFAYDSMLRSSDLLNVKVGDIMNDKGIVNDTLELKQKKTGVSHKIRLSKSTQEAIKSYLDSSSKVANDSLFSSQKRKHQAMSRHGYAFLIKGWAKCLNLDVNAYSTHSLRRTKASIVYKSTKDIAVCKELLGQQNISSTSFYLGVTKNDALKVSEKFDI